jgi:hypothetical protein
MIPGDPHKLPIDTTYRYQHPRNSLRVTQSSDNLRVSHLVSADEQNKTGHAKLL